MTLSYSVASGLSIMLFVESSRFSRDFARQATDEALRLIQIALMEDPNRGTLIPGTGGLRKLRWSHPRQQRGKRGGLRLLYLPLPDADCLHLLHCFAKNEKEDLTPQERREVKRLVEQLKLEARRSAKRR
jgi:hypothetical protein